MHAYKNALYIVGAAFEGVGLLLLWTPDIRPDIVAAWRTVSTRVARAWRRIGALLRRIARRPRSMHVGVADGFTVTDALAAGQVVRGVPDGTIAERVRYLVAHDRATQERLNVLERRADEEATARERDIATARAYLEAHAVTAALAAVDLGRRRRAIGTGLITIGLVVGTLGNLA